MQSNPNTPTPSLDISIQQVENFLSQHNSFCLLDWLLSENIIAYQDYEQWRYGKISLLQEKTNADDSLFLNLQNQMQNIANSLELEAEFQDVHSWDQQNPTTIKFSKNQTINQTITARWLRSRDIPQLDLFMDNTAVVTENALQQAFSARNFTEAHNLLSQLTKLNAKHPKLGVYRDLILYGEHIANVETIEPNNIEAELEGLEKEVAPIAQETLGIYARDFLAFAWRRLADNLHSKEMNNHANPKLLAAYCLMQIPDWPGAFALLQEDPQLFQEIHRLQYFAECSEQQKYTKELVTAWCKLFELDTEFAEDCIESRKYPWVWEEWQNFWEMFEEVPTHYFAAYLMAKNAGIIHYSDPRLEFTSPELMAMREALTTEISGQDTVKARALVKAQDNQLLGIYLRVRGSKH